MVLTYIQLPINIEMGIKSFSPLFMRDSFIKPQSNFLLTFETPTHTHFLQGNDFK